MRNSQEAEERKREKLQEDELALSLRGRPRQSLSELTPFQRMFLHPNIPPPPQPPPMQSSSLFMAAQPPQPTPPPPPPPPPSQQLPFQTPCMINPPPQDPTARRTSPPRPIRTHHRAPNQTSRQGIKTNPIPIPFPWATDRRATVQSLKYLFQNGIFNISGEVQCKRCDKRYEISFDLIEKFLEIWHLFEAKKDSMYQRAPSDWMNPKLPKCEHCNQENSVKPVIAEKKKEINWLFLLLGQMLGCCTIEQLKYFCKHTSNHRTGAKDRVLYLTYLRLCKQLDPENRTFDL